MAIILIVLILPIQEHGLSFCFFKSSLFSSTFCSSQHKSLLPPRSGLISRFFGDMIFKRIFKNFVFVIFHCQCKAIQQISACKSCILLLWWIHLLIFVWLVFLCLVSSLWKLTGVDPQAHEVCLIVQNYRNHN